MSTTQVEDWRFHIIRIVNQDDVKMDVPLILNLAMKYLLQIYHSKMKDLHSHVCDAVFKDQNILSFMSRKCELIQGPTHSFYVVFGIFIPSNISTSNSVATSPFLSRLFYKTGKTSFKIS